MVQHKPLGAGPLTAAALSIGAVSESPLSPGDPAAFLARLLDLRGSVELGHHLAAIERARSRTAPVDAAAVRGVPERAEARFSAVRADVDRVLVEPFQRRNKLPSPRDAFALLAETGALEARSGRAVASAADAMFAPILDLVSRAIDRARFEHAALREELAPEIAALGPRFGLLVRLDAALGSATTRGREQIEGRLLPALGRSFAQKLAEAVRALPDPVAPADVEAWFGARGFVRREIERGRAVALAVITHEERRTLALLEVA